MASSAAAANQPASATALDRLLAATAPGMAKVNAMILERARSHVELVPEVARYLIDAIGYNMERGKPFRIVEIKQAAEELLK